MQKQSTEPRYKIQPAGSPFSCGKLPNGSQVLIGVQLPELIVVRFTSEGGLAGFDKESIREDQLCFEALDIEQLIAKCMESHHLETSSISVTEFFITELDVGIRRLPEYLRDVDLDKPSDDEDDPPTLADQLRDWLLQGYFTFHFVEEYYMSPTGEVLSS